MTYDVAFLANAKKTEQIISHTNINKNNNYRSFIFSIGETELGNETTYLKMFGYSISFVVLWLKKDDLWNGDKMLQENFIFTTIRQNLQMTTQNSLGVFPLSGPQISTEKWQQTTDLTLMLGNQIIIIKKKTKRELVESQISRPQGPIAQMSQQLRTVTLIHF